MKVTVMKPVEVEVFKVEILLDKEYAYESNDPIPGIFTVGDKYRFSIAIDDGTLFYAQAFQSKAVALRFKPNDAGTYTLYNWNNDVIKKMEEVAVPSFLPGEYGDYLYLVIGEDGKVANWEKRIHRLQEVFAEEDD